MNEKQLKDTKVEELWNALQEKLAKVNEHTVTSRVKGCFRPKAAKGQPFLVFLVRNDFARKKLIPFLNDQGVPGVDV